MTTRTRRTERDAGLHVDGLTEALKALNRISKEVGKEARDAIREETIPIQKRAKAVSTGDPAEARSKAWIGRSVTTKGAAIVLRASKYPRALSTEWGSYTHPVYGRRRPDRYMRRAVFGDWQGNTFDVSGAAGPGRVIQPTIRRMLPRTLDLISQRLFWIMQRELDRAGVPRKGRS